MLFLVFPSYFLNFQPNSVSPSIPSFAQIFIAHDHTISLVSPPLNLDESTNMSEENMTIMRTSCQEIATLLL